MKTWLVCYADAAFETGRERLAASARAHGVDICRAWTRADLERTPFYRQHRELLALRRGGGYWLWKPYIIGRALQEADEGDVLIYADAGVEIVDDVAPLVAWCREREMLLFAGHYDDVGAPGRNTCGKWTKRDAFAFMECDEPRFHEGQMLDACALVVMRTRRTLAFVREWELLCTQPALLTDAPNRGELPNLDAFIEHRHDQSILSLLAIRDGWPAFRHPSQNGNHAKAERWRQEGEWIRWPYGTHGVYDNSPYPTIMRHHCGFLGQRDLRLALRHASAIPRSRLFEAWLDPDVWQQWTYLECRVGAARIDARAGGRLALAIVSPHRFEITDLLTGEVSRAVAELTLLEPPATIEMAWPPGTRLRIELHDRDGGTDVTLVHDGFPSERSRETYRRSWSVFFETLDRACAAAAAPASGMSDLRG